MTIVHEEQVSVPQSVLARAAAILGAFDTGEPVLPLADLSTRSGLPKSTVHRLAEQLVELGWLERSTSGYRVGLRLFEVGGLADRRTRLVERAVPHLHDLATASRCGVHLGILEDTEVVYLVKLPIRGLALPTRDGGRMPAHCTGLGKAMLAYANEEQVERVLAAGLVRRTATTIVDEAALRAELEEVRARGIAYDREEGCTGVACVAAPIRGSGRAIGAVSVSGVSDQFDFGRAESLVRRASSRIWDDLFGRPQH